MSVSFKFGDDKQKAEEKEKPQENLITYPTPANARFITFIDSKGEEETLFYSDLYSIKFSAEENTLVLHFHQREVIIKGSNLLEIKELFNSQEIKVLKTTDERYKEISDGKFNVRIEIKMRK